MFGYLGGGAPPFEVTNPGSLVTFAFQVLPLVIVMSALSALLWYWRILPLVCARSRVFEKPSARAARRASVATANIFVGQVEAPLLVRPYIARMTHYELLLLMTAGMSTIAGSVMVIYAAMLGPQFHGVLGHLLTKSMMSVPASILFAHLLLPEPPPDQPDAEPPRLYGGAMDAITRGTSDGLNIYLGILAMLLVLIAFVALANGASGCCRCRRRAAVARAHRRLDVRADRLADGHSRGRSADVGSLIGVKTVLNEFIAYIQLAELGPGALSDRSSELITIYALCGFANLAASAS
jgi:concentrative nucleoside transporter, CNT family